MKKCVINTVALLLSVVLFSFINVPVTPSALGEQSDLVSAAPSDAITVANHSTSATSEYEVYAARFLNMLNHNFVYGESFKSVEDIVNDSMPALLELRDSEIDSYIAEQYVTDYVFNMYGIEIFDYSEINSDFEQIDGYVYILPRGFAIYKHEIISIAENEDGSFTVKTNVNISSHDSGEYSDVCETLFVRNTNSRFGFSIIFSNIGDCSVAA